MTNYKTSNISKKELLQLNFRYDKRHSDSENELYIMRFPVYREEDSKRVTLESSIIINVETGSVAVDVYDNNYNQYTPWYTREYGKNNVVNIVDKNIDKKLKSLFRDKLESLT